MALESPPRPRPYAEFPPGRGDVASHNRSWKTARVYSPVPRAREASATPSGSGGRGARRLGWWARVAGLGLVVALLLGGGGRAAPAPTTATQSPLIEADRLVAYDGDNKEHFGFAVAVDGNTLAVGSSNATVGSHDDQGAVYVYVRIGGEWTFQAKLTAEDGAADDQLRIRGRPARRPARRRRPLQRSRRRQGAVYAFRRTGTTWTQDARINGRSSHNGDRFGWALDLSGATLAVGAPYEEQQNRHRLRRGAPVHRHTRPWRRPVQLDGERAG